MLAGTVTDKWEMQRMELPNCWLMSTWTSWVPFEHTPQKICAGPRAAVDMLTSPEYLAITLSYSSKHYGKEIPWQLFIVHLHLYLMTWQRIWICLALHFCTSLEVKLLQNEKFNGTEFCWCKNFAVLPITAWSSPVTTYVSASFLRSLVHRLLQNCKKWSFTLLSHPKNHLEVLFHSPNAVLRT